jgi:hypothetical protein
MDQGSLRIVLQHTIEIFMGGQIQAVKKKDFSLFAANLTGDCVRLSRPLSFPNRCPQFFKPQITNADYEAQMQVELQTTKDVSQNATRIVIDTTERKASVWIEKTVFTVNNTESVVEVILCLDFREYGSRMSQIMEFVDTFESTKALEQILNNNEVGR